MRDPLGESEGWQIVKTENYSNDGEDGTVVYLHRPRAGEPNSDVVEIKSPSELAGKLRFVRTADNGHGGSGRLDWITPKRDAKLGLGITDVSIDGRPNAILFLSDGDKALMGDCMSAYQLGKISK